MRSARPVTRRGAGAIISEPVILLLLWLQADDVEGRLRRRPQVSFDLRETPLRDAFAELGRRSGLSFEVDPAVASDRVTLRVENLGPFEAAHVLCRAHGRSRVTFATFTRAVQIVPAAPPTMPASDSGPFHTLVAHLQTTRSHSFDRKPERHLTLTLWLAWTPDGAPASLSPQVVITEAVDDSGRDLRIDPPPPSRHERLLAKPVCADPATVRLAHPDEKARRLRRIKGYREAMFVGETRAVRIDSLENLPAVSKGGELAITKFKRSPRGVSAVFEGPRPEGDFTLPDHHQGLCFVDDRGGRHAIRVSTTAVGTERVSFEAIAADIPEGARIVACESRFVSRWISWRIPFEFDDVELP